MLSEILEQLNSLPESDRQSVIDDAMAATVNQVWTPNPGPQTDAYFCEADELFYGGQAGGGKLLSLDTPIPTPFGWSTMGGLTVGDFVIDEAGKPCMVVAKSGVETEDTYKVVFSDGSEIVAGCRHQWVTSTYRERMRSHLCTDEYRAKRRAKRSSRATGKRPDVAIRNASSAKPENPPLSGIRTTREIAESLFDGERKNHSIPVCQPLDLPEAELLIEPYVLGAWLGDGATNSGRISGVDEEVFAVVGESYTVTSQNNPTTRGVLGLQAHLKQLGVFGNKHIPAAYLRASIGQRLSLLQGLMDTDGHCDRRGQCEIQLTNKALIDGVEELLFSLGIKVQIRSGRSKLYGKDCGEKWRLKFITDLPVFRISRKLIRQKRTGFRGTHNKRYIVYCEPVEPVPMQCIQVDSPNHMYLCGRAMIPTHNSALAVGLAMTSHERSLILRRIREDAKDMADDQLINRILDGSRAGWNGSDLIYRRTGKYIKFGGCEMEADKQRYKGKPHDLIIFDEVSDFLESQYIFISIWNRSTTPGQKCRVVATGNPPTTAEGLWVIHRWAPWLDPKHPNPAKPGELRWYISDEEGKEIEVQGRGPHQVGDKMVTAKSRTFIPASLQDNPDLAMDGEYERILDSLPKELRDAYRDGRFDLGLKDHPWQMIPTAWVVAAQERWKPEPEKGIPMCSIGVDVAQGGDDNNVLFYRHDGWFSEPIVVPGKETPLGTDMGATIFKYRKDGAIVVIDCGGGYGGSAYKHMTDNSVETIAYKGAENSGQKTEDRTLGFYNKRTEIWWRFREALDPDQPGGSKVVIPPNSRLLSDLTAPTYDTVSKVIRMEPKEKLIKRLGRSTDYGDAIVMCWHGGPRMADSHQQWSNRVGGFGGRQPKVIMGHKGVRRGTTR